MARWGRWSEVGLLLVITRVVGRIEQVADRQMADLVRDSRELFFGDPSRDGGGPIIGEGTVRQHLLCEPLGDWGGVGPEVSEHGVGTPSADEGDVVGSHIGAEKSGGPAWAEAAGRDLLGRDTGAVLDLLGGSAEEVRDLRRVDIGSLGFVAAASLVFGIVFVEGCGEGAAVVEDVLYPALESAGWAEMGVPAGKVGDLLSPDAVLLVSVGKGALRAPTHRVIQVLQFEGACRPTKGPPGREGERNVRHGKGTATSWVRGGGLNDLPRAVEVKESYDNDVPGVEVHTPEIHLEEVLDDDEAAREDTRGGRVLLVHGD